MQLTIYEPGRQPYTVDLEEFHKEVIGVGRQPDCDVVLQSDFVSRLHGCIYQENGQWYIEDVGSTYGLYCNGQRIKRKPLQNETRIVIPYGRQVVKLVCSEMQENYQSVGNVHGAILQDQYDVQNSVQSNPELYDDADNEGRNAFDAENVVKAGKSAVVAAHASRTMVIICSAVCACLLLVLVVLIVVGVHRQKSDELTNQSEAVSENKSEESTTEKTTTEKTTTEEITTETTTEATTTEMEIDNWTLTGFDRTIEVSQDFFDEEITKVQITDMIFEQGMSFDEVMEQFNNSSIAWNGYRANRDEIIQNHQIAIYYISDPNGNEVFQIGFLNETGDSTTLGNCALYTAAMFKNQNCSWYLPNGVGAWGEGIPGYFELKEQAEAKGYDTDTSYDDDDNLALFIIYRLNSNGEVGRTFHFTREGETIGSLWDYGADFF